MRLARRQVALQPDRVQLCEKRATIICLRDSIPARDNFMDFLFLTIA